MDTTDTTTTTIIPFDLDNAINDRVAQYHAEQVDKERQEEADRIEKVAERRSECELALEDAFPAELREALGMEIDPQSVENPYNHYPVSGYPTAVFALDDHLWHITLNYGNGVHIASPDGEGEKALTDDIVDTLLLQIGLWREREAERQRREREEEAEAEERALEEAVTATVAETATPKEPTPPRMIGDTDNTTAIYVLSESLSYYNDAPEQMLARFSGSGSLTLINQDGTHKPKRFTLSREQLAALFTARALHQELVAEVRERERQAREEEDETPF